MILNDLLTKQNVFSKIALQDGDKELPKALKVKVMRIRMAYSKVKKAFEEEVQEFTKELMTDELQELNMNPERNETEQARYEELINKFNSEYQEFMIQKGNEEVADIEDSLTMEEYSDILDVNSGIDVEINGNKVPAADFMEVVMSLFVKEE
jgi:predicted house-cleaning noncanonical NTP pyrophosphatase (MazG superfamily)